MYFINQYVPGKGVTFILVQSIYEKYLANPPQIATEAIPTVLCSEQPPKSQKKSLGKSNWWNIVKIIYN